MEQERLTRCPRCGELAGEALVDDPWEGPVYLPVLCLCDGIACRSCGRAMVRRPISNHYDEATGCVWHTPWFGALIPCRECRRRRQAGERLRRVADSAFLRSTAAATTSREGTCEQRS